MLTTLIIYGVSISYINYEYWNSSQKNIEIIADLYTKQSSVSAQSILQSDLKTVETLNNILRSYSSFDLKSRTKFYNQMLKDVLENNPQFLATWISWEIKTIDTQWPYEYGRIRTIAFINNGQQKITIDSVNLDGDIPGTYYYMMKTGVEKTLLSNPYFFSYTKDTSSSFLETSIGQGIYIGDRFIGAVGIDVSLERFDNIIKELKPFPNSKIIVVSNDGTIVAFDNKKFVGRNLLKIYPEFVKYQTSENIKSGLPFSFSYKPKGEEKEYVSFYPIKLSGSKMPWAIGFIVSTEALNNQIINNLYRLIIISIISILIISLFTLLIISIILRPLLNVTKSIEALSNGIITENIIIKYNSNDEIGRISKATNILISSLNKTQNFAIEIGKGNLETEFKQLSDNDILGKTLINMRDNLKKAKFEQDERKIEDQKVNWTQNGINQINELLRENSDNLESLTREIIKFLVKYSNSNVGGFYLIEKDEDIDIIKLKSSYAFDRFKEQKSEFLIGEGLVGRVVKEKKYVIIEDLPEGYLFVRSGLGEKSPSNLIIIPLMFENNILGAIEIASFKKIEQYIIEFLLEIVARITSSLSVMLKNIETANLLKESQLQTATFEMKEKQFIRQRQKLNEKQKEIDLKESQLGSIFEAMKILGNYIEVDLNLKIIDLNDYLPKNFNTTKENFINLDLKELTQLSKGTKVWNEKFWEDVKNGFVRKKQTIYSNQEKEISVNETFFKYKDKEIEKIIIIGL